MTTNWNERLDLRSVFDDVLAIAVIAKVLVDPNFIKVFFDHTTATPIIAATIVLVLAMLASKIPGTRQLLSPLALALFVLFLLLTESWNVLVVFILAIGVFLLAKTALTPSLTKSWVFRIAIGLVLLLALFQSLRGCHGPGGGAW